uniref:glutathione peroxidase 7-like n=1 Tax=Myxine glutinosa TaxID=7769 RepID=UPI00358FF9C1
MLRIPAATRGRVMILGSALLLSLGLLATLMTRSWQKAQDFYSFRGTNIRGKEVSLEKYRGSASLVVNVASDCGYTEDHYKALQGLQRDFGPRHFNVLAFPCNQFGSQEPGTNAQIESFARRVHGATFPMFAKTTVFGSKTEPAFKFLVDSTGKEPRWNFWKYLVDPRGKVVDGWGPETSVDEIRPHVIQLIREIILSRRDEL